MSHSSDSSNARQIWIISDGKPGHLNQSRGLAEALARQRSVSIHEQPALGRCQALGLLLRLGRSAEAQPSRPALLIGTGHGTHLSLLALKHHWGGSRGGADEAEPSVGAVRSLSDSGA